MVEGCAFVFSCLPALHQLLRFFPVRVEIILLEHEKQYHPIDPHPTSLGHLASIPPFYGGWLGSYPLLSTHHPEIDHNNIIIIDSQDPNQTL
jgi:hypothetical protein